MHESKRQAVTRFKRMPSDKALGAVLFTPSRPLWRPTDRKALQRRARVGTAANRARALIARLAAEEQARLSRKEES